MISLKAINTSYVPTKHALFHTRRTLNPKNRSICLCKSNNDSNSNSEASLPEGDINKQELLARIAMLQTEKVRLTDYIDESSRNLTQFTEETNAEFDKIGEDALKELDEASARIMEKIESQMQAFEESAELNRTEIEMNEDKLAEFEGQIVEDRNEGMFFKNLGQKPPIIDKAQAKVEAEKVKDLMKEKAGSKNRKNIYLALIAVVVISIADSFVNSPDWRKVAVLGAILAGLITQFSYEQKLASELESKEKTDKEKK
ncbi:uncharacterized protein LOC126656157 [Mercurialis annua]|uniref:uncharacterized protein LOC126656157 n=1 Tax=Mercurialis annua TaxID=3986 RepID=UPI00215E14CC|nr:uncharacterized protein LOC126656157 [Mercurialis annua]